VQSPGTMNNERGKVDINLDIVTFNFHSTKITC